MSEDVVAWLKLLWKLLAPFVWLVTLPYRILGWLNCVVVHKAKWQKTTSRYGQYEGLCGIIHHTKKERWLCPKCGRNHAGDYYNF